MKVNLSPLFSEEGKSAVIEVLPGFESVAFAGARFPVRDKSPVVYRMANQGKGRVQMTTEGSVCLVMRCDRCLREVEHSFDLHMTCELLAPDLLDEEHREAQEAYLEGYQLDTDALICNEIFTCWPMKLLCREDCRGLCKTCGKNLNEGDCGCDPFVPDPRMAAIMDLFREDKEV